ncbi:MAG: S41 family peptidase [Tannerella sp.]|nr:S41 family peptidase [Tannerella sp.]
MADCRKLFTKPTITGLVIFKLFLLTTGCELRDTYTTNPRTNFEALWKILDEHYCFFEYKQVDWNEIYRKYNIQVSDTMNQYVLFDFLGKMLSELKDGHTNLISSFNVARYWSWYEDYPSNFNEEIHKSYLGTDCLIAGGIKYRRLANNQVGYMYYGSFSNGVGENNLDYIFTHFKDCKGLIIDVRENGGGSLTYSDRIASRFLEEKMTVGYIRHKNGPGHNDFSNLFPIELSPSKRIRWMRPVVVITNRHSYSATNDFVNKMKILPHVIIMGDRTGGGSGLPFNSELPNGWIVRFSASPILDANKQDTEHGIDPDIQVGLTQADILRRKDTLIETAIQHLTKNTKE